MENTKRQLALKWWKELPFESKFFNTIEANHLIVGDHTRHPNTLTGREIEIIYFFKVGKTD